MSEDRIVAVALLTAREVNAIGPKLRRMFAVESAGEFTDLLAALDRIEGVPGHPVATPSAGAA